MRGRIIPPKTSKKIPPRQSTGIQSVEVAWKILKLLADGQGAVPVSDLAASAGMPRSQAHKYLTSFVRVGLAAQSVPGGPYDLGPEALELGLAAMRRLDVIEIAQEVLDSMRESLETTVALAVWANRGPTIVRWAETPQLTFQSARGTVFPILTSTTGLIFAAYLDRRFTDHLIRAELADPGGNAARLGLRRIADVEALLSTVRVNGMVAAASFVSPGVATVSAPVFEHGNRITAAIVVVGHDGQFDLSMTSPAARMLAKNCAELSQRMGARGSAR